MARYRRLFLRGLRRSSCTLLIRLVLCCALAASTRGSAEGSDSYASLTAAIAEGYENNLSRLRMGHIKWKQRTRDFGFESGVATEPMVETAKEFEHWWDGDKVAIDYSGTSRSGNPEVTGPLVNIGLRAAFNGKEFRAVPHGDSPDEIGIKLEPDFMNGTNWFEVTNCRWRELFEGHRKLGDDISEEFRTVEEEGKNLIELRVTSTRGEGSAIYTIDPQKAYSLIQLQFFDGSGNLYMDQHTTVSEVVEGIWFPVAVDAKTLVHGEVSLHNQYEVDLTQSSFNNPSDVPPEVFEIAIEPDMEVSDYRSGVRIDYGGKNGKLLTKEDAQSLVAEFMQDETRLATPLKIDAKELPKFSNKPTPFLHRSYYAIRQRKALVVSVGLASVAVGMLVLAAARRRSRRSGNR